MVNISGNGKWGEKNIYCFLKMKENVGKPEGLIIESKSKVNEFVNERIMT